MHSIVLVLHTSRVLASYTQLYLESERALARKFAPIPFHSRARRTTPVCVCVAAETGKTDGRNEIFRSDCTRRKDERRLSFVVSCITPLLSFSFPLVPHFPSTVTSASSITLYRVLSSRIRGLGVARSALLIDSRRLNRCLITSQLDRGV